VVKIKNTISSVSGCHIKELSLLLLIRDKLKGEEETKMSKAIELLGMPKSLLPLAVPSFF